MDQLLDIKKAVNTAKKTDNPVFIVKTNEEKAALISLGYEPVIAGSIPDFVSELAGTKVVLVGKNTEDAIIELNADLQIVKKYAYATKVIMPSQKEAGDIVTFSDDGFGKVVLDNMLDNTKYNYASYISFDKTGKMGINADILADTLLDSIKFIIVKDLSDSSEKIYLYNHGLYECATANMVKKEIKKYFPLGMASDYAIRNVYNLLLCFDSTATVTMADLDRDEDYINFRNGMLNIRTWTLENHKPELYSTLQYDFDYDPDNHECPVFDKYMNDLCTTKEGEVDEEMKARIQEFCGLVLSNVVVARAKKAMLLVSPIGNTGKSQLLKLLSLMLGKGRTANIPLQSMSEKNRFALSQSIGTRLIAVGDQTAAIVNDSSTFKMLTGADAIRIEPKNKQPYDFYYGGGVIIACNEAPTFKDDKGSHVFERLLVIPCEHIIEKDEMDVYITDKMLTEKSAIFNWCMDGLKRLLDNDFKFTESVRADEFMQSYRGRQDTVFRFCNEVGLQITKNPHDVVKKSSFDKAYEAWLKSEGIDGMAIRNLKYRMEKLGAGLKKTSIDGQAGVYGYTFVKDTTGYLDEYK